MGRTSGDAQKLGLTARHLAVELGVAEQRGAHPLVTDLRGLALRLQPALTHEAVPAGDVEGDHHPIAGRDARHLAADRLDDAHGLVPEHVAFPDERPEHFVEM